MVKVSIWFQLWQQSFGSYPLCFHKIFPYPTIHSLKTKQQFLLLPANYLMTHMAVHQISLFVLGAKYCWGAVILSSPYLPSRFSAHMVEISSGKKINIMHAQECSVWSQTNQLRRCHHWKWMRGLGARCVLILCPQLPSWVTLAKLLECAGPPSSPL